MDRKKKSKLTSVSVWNFVRLGYRSALLILFVIVYMKLTNYEKAGEDF